MEWMEGNRISVIHKTAGHKTWGETFFVWYRKFMVCIKLQYQIGLQLLKRWMEAQISSIGFGVYHRRCRNYKERQCCEQYSCVLPKKYISL